MELTAEELLELYYYMRLMRAIEDRAWVLATQGRLVGRLYTGHGQEAIPVGSAYALQPDDIIAPMYRDMGALLIRGVTPGEIFAQYMGKRTSSNRGKDSGLHIGDLRRGLIGMISILPDSLPVAVGAALTFKIRKEPRVALTYFGDGATSTGGFHEGVNMAAVLRVPAIFICENNQWALSTPNEKEFAVENIADRAAGYGIPGVIVDGNDVLQVYRATREAAERARAGGGPTLIEAKTMRMKGHSMIDPAHYVPPEQLEAWAAHDPIQHFAQYLHEQKALDEKLDHEIGLRIAREVDEGVEWAERQPDPMPQDVYTDVFAPAEGIYG
ncbi:MAG: thiamine pyrophosphate-dependent dehydrogenase E1 component subunit alpha [Chloroflexi bacterium]|nr:MAG: thiamine pyrophosphate-dependent dehydrogenase E1 component subunit alpha [Chloroflexota bacterium]